MKCLKITFGVLASTFILANTAIAKEKFGTLTRLRVNAKLDSSLTVGAIFSQNTGHHHEQNSTIDNSVIYDTVGTSGTEYGIAAKLLLGTIGKAEISGIGELTVYNRVLADSNIGDTITTPGKLRVYYPRTGIFISVPFGRFFELQMNNTFERRLMTLPKPVSLWFWSPQLRLESIPFTMINISIFGDYQGYDNEDVDYLATSSFGLKSEPIEDFNLDLFYKFQWKPDNSHSNRISQINLALEYTFDLSK